MWSNKAFYKQIFSSYESFFRTISADYWSKSIQKHYKIYLTKATSKAPLAFTKNT